MKYKQKTFNSNLSIYNCRIILCIYNYTIYKAILLFDVTTLMSGL